MGKIAITFRIDQGEIDNLRHILRYKNNQNNEWRIYTDLIRESISEYIKRNEDLILQASPSGLLNG